MSMLPMLLQVWGKSCIYQFGAKIWWENITGNVASTSCHTSGVRYCKICQLSMYSDTHIFHPLHNSTWAIPSISGHAHINLVSMVLPGMPPHHPHTNIDAKFFPPYFCTKLVSIPFSLRHEEALLALTSWKLVCIQMLILFYYIGLSFSTLFFLHMLNSSWLQCS